ncbi:DUF6084 family protein [Actinomadura chibensis]|uniref:Uncharacterized protein n=1 Tax=Actinomadura chibensis TaxID=392828 RepID=A0A5D0NPF8_9ACTN|nr:DUF6084 family protein [Actinomadura chibensis]TYB46416.1 hypothetical protein FXF69_14270 [Actinomadura chibensis]
MVRGRPVPEVFRGVRAGQSAFVTIMNGPPDLGVDLLGIEAGTSGSAPAPSLRLRLRRLDGGPVQCVLLTATVTIAAGRRGYDDAERDRLAAVLGPPAAWPPGGLPWARVGATVPTFRGGTEAVIALPCGHGMPDAAARYLDALQGGHVPLDLAFDGTVFYPGGDGSPRTGQAPWRHEAAGLLAVRTWRDLADRRDARLRLDEPSR